MQFEAKWSGSYPTKCHGRWSLTVKVGIDNVPIDIPEDKVTRPMDTRGVYSSWHFENWSEVFDNYTDGLKRDEWIAENREWLTASLTKIGLRASEKRLRRIYDAFQASDWRHNSCGGCV